jgi:hypothetical protein
MIREGAIIVKGLRLKNLKIFLNLRSHGNQRANRSAAHVQNPIIPSSLLRM